MDRKNKILSIVGLLAVALAIALFSSRSVHAQGSNNASTGGGPGAGLPQKTDSGTISIAGGTPAILISASTTGKAIRVKEMQLSTITTGGIVTFYNGADATKFLSNAYVVPSTTVNNNVRVPEGLCNFVTAANQPLCAQLNGCTLVWTIRYQLE